MMSPATRLRSSSATFTRARRSLPSTRASVTPSSRPRSVPASALPSVLATFGLAAVRARSRGFPSIQDSLLLALITIPGIAVLASKLLNVRLEMLVYEFRPGGKLRIDRQSFTQHEPCGRSSRSERRELRPRGFWIDEVSGHRRTSTPIIDTSFQQIRIVLREQIGRRLNIDLAAENQAGNCNGALQIFFRGLRRLRHANIWLGAKRLDDHFLDMTVFSMCGADRLQCVHPFLRSFTDPDQDARRERYRQLSRILDGAQAKRGDLVESLPVRSTPAAEPRPGALEHQPHADVRLSQAAKILQAHQTGIGMRQKTGLLEHQLAHGRKVFEGAIEAQCFQKLSRFREYSLGLVAQAEQSLFAPCKAARFRYCQHFVRRHVGIDAVLGIRAERAVAAIVPAKMGEWNEDLPGIADRTAFGAVPNRGSRLEQGR